MAASHLTALLFSFVVSHLILLHCKLGGASQILSEVSPSLVVASSNPSADNITELTTEVSSSLPIHPILSTSMKVFPPSQRPILDLKIPKNMTSTAESIQEAKDTTLPRGVSTTTGLYTSTSISSAKASYMTWVYTGVGLGGVFVCVGIVLTVLLWCLCYRGRMRAAPSIKEMAQHDHVEEACSHSCSKTCYNNPIIFASFFHSSPGRPVNEGPCVYQTENLNFPSYPKDECPLQSSPSEDFLKEPPSIDYHLDITIPPIGTSPPNVRLPPIGACDSKNISTETQNPSSDPSPPHFTEDSILVDDEISEHEAVEAIIASAAFSTDISSFKGSMSDCDMSVENNPSFREESVDNRASCSMSVENKTFVEEAPPGATGREQFEYLQYVDDTRLVFRF